MVEAKDGKSATMTTSAFARAEVGYLEECARADFYGEPRPPLFSRLKRKLSGSQLQEFIAGIPDREEYIRRLSRLNADPIATEKRQRMHQPPQVIDRIPAMSMSKLGNLWKNALNAISDPRSRHLHIQARLVLNAINDEWRRRRTEPNKEDGYFSWPSSQATGGDGSLSGQGWPLEGMLSYLGYRVGATQGEPAGVRQKVLTEIFSSSLPPILPAMHLAEWGAPNSAARLKKMAECIAAFSRNAKRRHDWRLATAIEQWDSDLDYLFHEFYVGKFHFAWPSPALPDI